MNKAMKGAIVLLLACLITAGVSCSSSEEANEIKIGVIGPMQFQMGEHHWLGATLAADEINAAKHVLFCVANAIPNPLIAAVRPRAVSVVELADKFVISYLEAPVEQVNQVMADWVGSLRMSG